ncbi:MAG TPA: 50S ribosomal protein L24 [Dehalococcoidia bacterium]|jgi:large subunit ribosomal protein L24|nr:50S ribosomal protein L24 [Dehalococcoidia bacterium]
MRKVKRDDTVLILAGRDRGKTGVVRQVVGGGDLVKVKGHRPKVTEDMVFVTGINIAKKHKKQQPGVQQAGIIDKEMPMPLSKVMVICKSCNKPVRVGFVIRNQEKHRVCRNCGEDID